MVCGSPTPGGPRRADRSASGFTEEELGAHGDPFGAFSVDKAVDEGWLELDPSVKEKFERYAELSLRRRGAVTVYAAPLDFEP